MILQWWYSSNYITDELSQLNQLGVPLISELLENKVNAQSTNV